MPDSVSPPDSPALSSLDRLRQDLRAPVRPRPPLWALMVCALFAASMGVSVAAVVIFGPGGAPEPPHALKLRGR